MTDESGVRRSGESLLDLVAVMDRLRSPGGCPWDAEQTHTSLIEYLVEEAYEAIEAIEIGSRADIKEELGDVLLQVVFHSRIAQEHGEDPFDIGDVARGVVEKLTSRHPHVFGDVSAADADEVEANWVRLKAAEKQRASVLDGIPNGLPALALAAKTLSRTTRGGVDVAAPQVDSPEGEDREKAYGETLLGLVAAARAEGIDAEAALRAAVRDYAATVRAVEPKP